MTRSEIEKLGKYGLECFNDAMKDEELKDKLLSLAEKHFKVLIEEFDAQCIDPMAGYCWAQLGKVQVAKKEFEEAEKSYMNALNNLIVRGEYCQDRADSYLGLARVYMNLNEKEKAIENLERAVHVYDSIAMFDKLKPIDEEFKSLGFKVEDNLPVMALNEKGEPKKCRECGGTEFKLVEEHEDRKVFQCVNCNCRNVVLKKKVEVTT
jgi:tetratricopeptide (TPR) repeat protein